MSHAVAQTVLLIEADDSLRRLITLGLRHRGMHVVEASSPAELPALETLQLQLLVLDVDAGVRSDWSLLAQVQAHSQLASLPVVVLAWDYLPQETSPHIATQLQTSVTCLSKPFDARALHTTIEQLLASTQAANVAKTEAVLLAAHSTGLSSSIWPLITAAGLLLAFIGLMISVGLTAVGILIVMVALLWWTLGTKEEHTPLAIAHQ